MCDTSYDDLMGLKQGSPPFTPPEACDHHANTINGKALDIWCLGVTLFCFLHGRLPFEVSDGNILELFQLILHSEPVYFAISDSAKALLTRMLKKYAYQRIKLSQIKTHDWVTLNGDWPMLSKEENCTVIELTPEEVENAVTSMGTFTRFIHRVKKAASFRSKSPNGDSDSKRDTSSLSRCSSPGISQDYLDSGFNINKSSRK
ncbi:Calcium/calmodulin-dependent protein kinase kinase 1 [Coelomomyces lativittatus]|nr:Calcium/calmodulin-dependent protein kinase kinase 1 [Coelomomyces lativittatus]KAJ1516825.1 Calcium/calmodulin-dependent protein kinase kinase 1 [Coelomomyces lativittatus]KAJ1517405.1 Calcium/calmodulin-dependent protein kinase kinase 1 [Coelomomyces lativittatus]